MKLFFKVVTTPLLKPLFLIRSLDLNINSFAKAWDVFIIMY